MSINDHVLLYSRSAGLQIKEHTVFVEGTSDVEYFKIAANLEREAGGDNLLNGNFAIIAAGEREEGGVDGVVRQIVTFRQLSKTYIRQNSSEVYRFLAVFDNDRAGRRAMKTSMDLDAGIIEFRDVLCLFPVMNAALGDASAIGRSINRDNPGFKGIDWEIEDMLAVHFVEAFLEEYPSALKSKTISPGGHTHRELTKDGKAQLLRYTRQMAMREDLSNVITALRGLRCYVGMR